MADVPLQDHFRPPLSTRRHWHAFHNAWATYLSSDLNAHLPPGYFAEPNVQFGIEIDVAAFEEKIGGDFPPGSATVAAPWAPPAPVQTVPFMAATDTVEVLVYDSREGPVLAGAIELVSPANKDRPANREAFVSKCETYLQGGAGLAMIDVVTDRLGSLHQELLSRIGRAPTAAADMYAGSYRPIEREGTASLDIWHQPLAVGEPLPTMPLWLRGGICLPVDFGQSYDRTCRELRVSASPVRA